MTAPRALPAALAGLALAACTATAGPPPPSADVGGAPPTLLAQTRADAAHRASVAESAVVLRIAEAVTWPNGALGCAQPDRVYTQALVRGWRVVWQAGGREWHFHAGRSANWLWCPSERVQAPLADGGSR